MRAYFMLLALEANFFKSTELSIEIFGEDLE